MSKRILRRTLPELEVDNYLSKELHPILKRIYLARAILTLDEIEKDLSALLSFKLLLNIDAAAERLAEALARQQRILIVGDFDADGATSTALAVAALRAMGGKNIDYLVPNRFEFGYGLTPEIVNLAKSRNPDLIITVDNGIASLAGVARAHDLGIDVLITDHHLPGTELPEGCIIVNPNQAQDKFPSKCMAGVGVIFYVMLALRAHLQNSNWFADESIAVPNMTQFLDLVALGTVADVVPLDKNNRILVHQGLARIRQGRCRAGIKALLQVAKREANKLVAADLGFAIGPRLNAAGRLDDMSLGINCLLAEDEQQAYQMALQLEQLNLERRELEAKMQQQAFNSVDRLILAKELPLGLCLFDPNWHQGIVGLVASRVKDKVHRPVIAFAKVDENLLKGSARSIPGIHIRDILDAVATRHPHLLSKFGGHAMAAGLSIAAEDLTEFSQAFADEISQHIAEADLFARIDTDGELASEDLTVSLAELLRDAGPWGQGFPEPIFDGEFKIIEQRLVGMNHLKLNLQSLVGEQYFDAIAFNINADEWPNHRVQRAHLVYKLDINEYQNRRKVQLIVQHITII